MEGRKVYLRRNPKAWQEAWVFDAKSDEYLGIGKLGYWSTAALATSSLELAKVNEVIKAKVRQRKTLKSLKEEGFEITERDLVRYQAQGLRTDKGVRESTAERAKITTLTEMDAVAAKMKRTGTGDISIFRISDDEAEAAKAKCKPKYHFLKS